MGEPLRALSSPVLRRPSTHLRVGGSLVLPRVHHAPRAARATSITGDSYSSVRVASPQPCPAHRQSAIPHCSSPAKVSSVVSRCLGVLVGRAGSPRWAVG